MAISTFRKLVRDTVIPHLENLIENEYEFIESMERKMTIFSTNKDIKAIISKSKEMIELYSNQIESYRKIK